MHLVEPHTRKNVLEYEHMKHHTLSVSRLTHLLLAEKASAPLWLVVRLYVGYAWLIGGIEKLESSAWVGTTAGGALTGFIKNALTKTGGAHPDVSAWYAHFLESVVLPHVWVWSHAIALGETAVGLGLTVGLFTGVAAFFGSVMNLNFLLAGTVSTNPVLLVLGLALLLARRVAGHIGLDRYAHGMRHTLHLLRR